MQNSYQPLTLMFCWYNTFMYVTSLEISGFKSFATKATLRFTSPITAIVGPNGSGKSNVAEAFRFVLGEQSVKSLRGKRGEDLIFSGAAEAGRVNRASVKIVFNNEKRLLPVAFDEVTIERVVHRDSTNEYLLNGSTVRLKDILEMLAAAHIGPSGHHIISQGEADRLLSAPTRERRDMIEDALGLKVYQFRKQESERKLAKTADNIEKVESLRRELAPHLRFLRKQMEKAEKTRELKMAYTKASAAYIAYEYARLDTLERSLNERRREPEALLQSVRERMAELKRTMHTATAHVQQHPASDIEHAEAALATLRVRKQELAKEEGVLLGEHTALMRAIARAEDAMKAMAATPVSLTVTSVLPPVPFATVRQHIDEISAYIDSVGDITNVGDATRVLVAIKERLQGFIERLERDAASRTHTGSKKSHTTAPAVSELDALQREREQLRTRMAALAAQVQQIAHEEHQATVRLADIRQKMAHASTERLEVEHEILKLSLREQEIDRSLAGVTAQAAEALRDREALKQYIERAYHMAGRDAAHYEGVVVGNVDCSSAAQAARRTELERMIIRLEDAGGSVGDDVMKEYKDTEERDAYLARELEDLLKAKASLATLAADLDARIDHEFRAGLFKINTQFKHFFTLMFGGGEAELVVTKEKPKKTEELEGETVAAETSTHDLAQGIDINIALPRKKIKGLMMLSGGERALTSTALLFAMSQVNPPPFIILDETDAALDEANSRRYGDMIQHLSAYSQLILITHNRETMSRAGVLYGVTMSGHGASQLLSIQLDEAIKVAKV
jgi:chromosome segregation protein